jgi:uncharacterized membrane protein (UPF0182 family)
MSLALVVAFAAPRLVSALYVRPNEISLERPYIQTHIHATRSAYGLEQRVKRDRIQGRARRPLSTPRSHKDCWTTCGCGTGSLPRHHHADRQALRPYYVFHDSDVDRYTIDGQYRQVLLAPRELDLANFRMRANWINPAFIYTHGYGLVLAEVSKITPDGLPVLLIEDARPKSRPRA